MPKMPLQLFAQHLTQVCTFRVSVQRQDDDDTPLYRRQNLMLFDRPLMSVQKSCRTTSSDVRVTFRLSDLR